jgi:hypothetical protein
VGTDDKEDKEEGKDKEDKEGDKEGKEGKGGNGKGKGKGSKPKPSKPKTRKEKVTKTAKRVHHVPLKSTATFKTPVPPISPAVIADAIARNREMLAAEERRREDAESKNRLEAYILSTRDRLGEDEEVKLVSTEEQRAELLKLFDEVRSRAERRRRLLPPGRPPCLRFAARGSLPAALSCALRVHGSARQVPRLPAPALAAATL